MTKNNNKLILISMSLVFGWVMSLPYEGPVLYAISNDVGLNWISLNLVTVFFHFMGLASGGLFSKNSQSSKKTIIISTALSIILSMSLPAINESKWIFIIPILSILTGIIISSNAHLIKSYINLADRNNAAADVLIWGNMVLISAHIFANNLSSISAFILIEIFLALSLIAAYKIELDDTSTSKDQQQTKNSVSSLLRDYLIFFAFIFLITINSGIMFQVIYPYFGEFYLLTSIYTNIPYIVAIYLLSRKYHSNKFYLLYVGLALWGITFILLPYISPTRFGFVIICTIMLSATGIFDYFWWSTMFKNLDSFKNPSILLGTGLATNVLGVWFGGILGNLIMSKSSSIMELSLFGLLVVLASMLILLPLNRKLEGIIGFNEFLINISHMEKKNLESLNQKNKKLLTKREYEVYILLLSGITNIEIGEALFVSTNTVKTHNRNIYKKLGVSNKSELIKTHSKSDL